MEEQRIFGKGLFFVGLSVLILLFATDYMGWRFPERGAIVSLGIGTLSFLIGIYIILKLKLGGRVNENK